MLKKCENKKNKREKNNSNEQGDVSRAWQKELEILVSRLASAPSKRFFNSAFSLLLNRDSPWPMTATQSLYLLSRTSHGALQNLLAFLHNSF